MTDEQRVESMVDCVALALAKSWSLRFRGNEREYGIYLDDRLREDAATAINAMQSVLTARAEQAEAEVERLREVGAGAWVPAEQFVTLRAENEAMRAAMVVVEHCLGRGTWMSNKRAREALAPFTQPEREAEGE